VSRARQGAGLLAVGAIAAAVGFGGAAWLAGADDPVVVTVAQTPAPAAPAEALPPPAVPPERAPPAREEPPAPQPAPEPAPEPDPDPDPRPETAPAPEAPPAPPELPARVLAPPSDPPRGVAIPAGAAPSGADAAHRTLVEALGRAVPRSTERADIGRMLEMWRLYLGPVAPPEPEGRRRTVARTLRANAWWFARRGSPAGPTLLRDEDGILLTYRAGQGFAVNPVATTGRWRDLNDDVSSEDLGDALLGMAVERRAGDRGFLAWEYYDVADDPSAVRPGTSGMAQARVALGLADAHRRTGDPRYAQGALGAMAALTVDVGQGGVRSMVSVDPSQTPLPWYVERAYPGESPWKGAALNGFMVSITNLRSAAALLRMPTADPSATPGTAARLAAELADQGAASLARHLADHDTGSWSLYGLLTPGHPWRSYLANLNYHCYHVRLLTELAEDYPDKGFAERAATWQGYVDRAGAECPAR
jgi:hypothetical protein